MIDAFRWSDDEEDDDGDAQEDDGDASSTNDDGEYSEDGEDHDVVLNQEGGDNDGDSEIEPVRDDDDIDDNGQQWHPTWEHRKFEEFYEKEYAIVGTWHLLESCDWLHMVRREWILPFFLQTDHTRKLDVFEAEMDAGAWVPVTGGLGGQAIFISELFSMSVAACTR
uniref:KIB1-4 beta-propeller domain-containing protein n=1 Tax=Oryza meridionalis TaxID=40149 RepID=A0A0E0EBM0_9ORYZ